MRFMCRDIDPLFAARAEALLVAVLLMRFLG